MTCPFVSHKSLSFNQKEPPNLPIPFAQITSLHLLSTDQSLLLNLLRIPWMYKTLKKLRQKNSKTGKIYNTITLTTLTYRVVNLVQE